MSWFIRFLGRLLFVLGFPVFIVPYIVSWAVCAVLVYLFADDGSSGPRPTPPDVGQHYSRTTHDGPINR